MKLNVGPIDSVIRILIGITLLFSALMGYIGAWGYLGVLFIATGMGRTCPIYAATGINTNKAEEAAEHSAHH